MSKKYADGGKGQTPYPEYYQEQLETFFCMARVVLPSDPAFRGQGLRRDHYERPNENKEHGGNNEGK
jgi:predicted GNAT superfamily acetyltransferase